jgi:cyclase
MCQWNRRVITGLIGGALLCALGSTPAASQAVDIERISSRVLVANLLFVGRTNVVAVSTKTGLVLIDTGFTPLITTRLKQEIERQFGREDWAYLINTHAHEHVGGNRVFKGIPILAHESIADDVTPLVEFLASEEKRAPGLRFIRGKEQELQTQIDSAAANSETLRVQLVFWQEHEREMAEGFEVVAPTVKFSEDLTLDMGDITVHAMFLGRGHSRSDVAVYVPEERLLVSGGVCHPFFPRIPEAGRLADLVQLADLKRLITVLDRVLDEGVQRVVAGHAEVAGRSVVARWRDYHRDLLAAVATAQEDGLSLEQAQARLSLDQRFPYMREVGARGGGSREEIHTANVAAAWRLLRP